MTENEKDYKGRLEVLLIQAAFCATTIAFTCMDWVKINFISNMQILGLLKFLSSKYSIFESYTLISKIKDIVDPIKYNVMLVQEILAIIVIALYALLILLVLGGNRKSIKFVSFAAMSVMIILFIIMMVAINTLNSDAAEKSNEKIARIFQATEMPYFALISSICVTLMNYFKPEKVKEKLNSRRR